jgi:hypothetical protein
MKKYKDGIYEFSDKYSSTCKIVLMDEVLQSTKLEVKNQKIYLRSPIQEYMIKNKYTNLKLITTL